MQKGAAGVLILIGILAVGLGIAGAWYTKIIQIPNLPPPGCKYQKVSCIKAPCNPILVCAGPVYTIQPVPKTSSPVSVTSPFPVSATTSASLNPIPTDVKETTDWKTSCLNIIKNPETKYKECEMIRGKYTSTDNKQLCEEIGGQYIDCTSPCRNDPPGSMCATVCIPLCKFQ